MNAYDIIRKPVITEQSPDTVPSETSATRATSRIVLCSAMSPFLSSNEAVHSISPPTFQARWKTR